MVDKELGRSSELNSQLSFAANVFRHGESRYRQTRTTVQEANDLTKNGIDTVRRNTHRIARSMDGGQLVTIQASPVARSIQTGLVAADVLDTYDIPINTTPSGESVHVNELLRRSSYDARLVNPLIFGGLVEIENEAILIDPKKTNPDDLDFHTYLFTEAIRKIPPEVKEPWPAMYTDYIDNLEGVEANTMRMINVLKSLPFDPYQQAILVSHGSLVGFMSYLYSGQVQQEIKPGEFIALQAVPDAQDFHVTGAGSLPPRDGHVRRLFQEVSNYFNNP